MISPEDAELIFASFVDITFDESPINLSNAEKNFEPGTVTPTKFFFQTTFCTKKKPRPKKLLL